MHYPLTDIQADFEINRPIRYQITAKINSFHRRQTDGQTDRRTDRRHVRQLVVFFEKRKKLLKIACCINLQLPILFFDKSIKSDMHHRITYIYINFQQNWVSRSIKTVRTNIFESNCKLHKFATLPIIYF